MIENSDERDEPMAEHFRGVHESLNVHAVFVKVDLRIVRSILKNLFEGTMPQRSQNL